MEGINGLAEIVAGLPELGWENQAREDVINLALRGVVDDWAADVFSQFVRGHRRGLQCHLGRKHTSASFKHAHFVLLFSNVSVSHNFV